MTMPTFVTKFVKTLDEIYDEVLKFITPPRKTTSFRAWI